MNRRSATKVNPIRPTRAANPRLVVKPGTEKGSPSHSGRVGDDGAEVGGWEQSDEKVVREKQGDLAVGQSQDGR